MKFGAGSKISLEKYNKYLVIEISKHFRRKLIAKISVYAISSLRQKSNLHVCARARKPGSKF